MLFDRKGGAEPLKLPPGEYEFPRVSPDGKRIAFETTDGKEAVVSIYELSGASSVRRLTFGGNNRFPIWSADGRRVAFQSDRDGDSAVFWQPVDGGTAERLTKPDPGTSHVPESWSPDGEVLLFSATKDFVSSLWTFSLRDRKATPFGDVQGFVASDQRDVLTRRPLGGVPDGRSRGDRRYDVRPAVPANRYEVSDRARWAAAVVPRRQGAVLRAGAGPVHGRHRERRNRASRSRIRSRCLEDSGWPILRRPRTFDIMPDGRIVGIGTAARAKADPGRRRFTSC